MTRARYVTPGQTAARIERLRTLVTALLAGDMSRDDIGALLSVSPSGVRKYLADLCQMIEVTGAPGEQIAHLVATAAETRAYLDSLTVKPSVRPGKRSRSALSIVARDSSRHLHLIEDDVQYPVHLNRRIPAHEPLHAAFYGLARAEVHV